MQYLNLFIQPISSSVVFPYSSLQLHNVDCYNQSLHSQYIGLVSQIDDTQSDVQTISQYSLYGTLVHLAKEQDDSSHSYKAFAFARFRINSFCQLSPFLVANVEILNDDIRNHDTEILTLFKEAIKIYMENFSLLQNALLKQKIDEEDNIVKLYYQVSSRIQIPFNQKIRLLQMNDNNERISTLIQYLNHKMTQYTTNYELEQKLKQELMSEMQNNGDNLINQTQQIIPQIQELELDYQKQYIESLPWGIVSPETLSIQQCKEKLDKKHYGLDMAKQRILQYLAIKFLTKSTGSIICLHGHPGVGKTSLAQSIAESLGRPFQKISLGGVSDEAQIRGHRKTYVGAQAGMIMEAIKKAKCVNPVILLDEIDKINQYTVGSALLEVLDPEQNKSFTDNYVNEEFNLSQVLFISTANYIGSIQPALRDRLEMIEIPSYTIDEKEKIAIQYLIPKQLELNAIDGQVDFNKEVVRYLITNYTNESGVRQLERQINSIFRKIALQQVRGKRKGTYNINKGFINQCLGESTFGYKNIKLQSVGMCKGLNDGMNILEVIKTKGQGNLYQQSKDQYIVEQGITALSYLRNCFKHIQFQNWDINVANQNCLGVCVVVAMVSLFMNKKVKSSVAFAGELSLKGSIFRQDNLRESIISAAETGVESIIIPSQNVGDIQNLEPQIKKRIRLVDHIEEVFQLAFEDGFTYYHYPNL
ncbi:unnamed protein product (macronuclear) [Paramecium tetraurelia]|uniref:endopeptidase La n=1 Tax=Paramecium tetraurelia TaxID=5888 RepID=A0CBA9_PARTE|nr:uncharacterized protein GSPATT00036859001 [Paramecium tetraurelia]CAK68076.1 unnamed protein product [Paramecium tetraurelia]|eukprot:XP_001435473.1 hypothetical protein (macronuclear) [Paramecium tetraurelia strain d4-2]